MLNRCIFGLTRDRICIAFRASCVSAMGARGFGNPQASEADAALPGISALTHNA